MDNSAKKIIKINSIPPEVDKSFFDRLIPELNYFYENASLWFEKNYKDVLVEDNKNKERQFVVCISDNKIVGVSLLKITKDDQKISTLYVDEDYRRQGIGTCLIRNSLGMFNQKYKHPTLFFNDKILSKYSFFPYFLYKEGFECKTRDNENYFYVK